MVSESTVASAEPAGRINYLWRLLATASAFTFFGIGGVLIPLLAAPVLLLIYPDRQVRQARARLLMSAVFRLFIHYMRLVGILDWEYKNLDRLHRPGQLILANHPTLLDVVFLVALVPGANCLVKAELLRNPAMRGFVSMTGFIFNDSGEQLVELAAAQLRGGTSLIIFPEGTRTRQGQRLQFQRGAAHIALQADVAPTPVLIRCNPATLSKQHEWYDIPDRRFRMNISVHDELPIDDLVGEPSSVAARQLSRRLENYFSGELHRNGTRAA